jgi:hypothetical protein
MADAKPKPDLLRFLNEHYNNLKGLAETDNKTPDLPNENITAVITLIDKLYETITTTGDISHDEIVKQLKNLHDRYDELNLEDPYSRYKDASARLNNLNTIVFNIRAGSEGTEAGAGAGEEKEKEEE